VLQNFKRRHRQRLKNFYRCQRQRLQKYFFLTEKTPLLNKLKIKKKILRPLEVYIEAI
jgi:hypothetical protein